MKNGKPKWQDSMALEILQLDVYQTFCDLGKGAKTPPGYKQIYCHFVLMSNMMANTRVNL